jgi:hypothetical protein
VLGWVKTGQWTGIVSSETSKDLNMIAILSFPNRARVEVERHSGHCVFSIQLLKVFGQPDVLKRRAVAYIPSR